MMELAVMQHSKCCALWACRFDSDWRHKMLDTSNKPSLAYLIGLAIGDGNLSNPNGRAVRLRITCDKKYPNIISEIQETLKIIAPRNKVSLFYRTKNNAIDISCYSNDWENVLGWKAKNGSKIKQKISVPKWIKENEEYSAKCLKGLFQTDGSIYHDRKYLTANFVSCIPTLANDVFSMIENIGFKPNMQKIRKNTNIKHTIRISRDCQKFIDVLELVK